MKSLKLVLATLLLTTVSRARAKPEYTEFLPNGKPSLKKLEIRELYVRLTYLV